MNKPFNIAAMLGVNLSPRTTGPRATAAPEVGKPTLVPGRAGDPDLAKAAAKTAPGYIGPGITAAAVPVSGVTRADLAEAGFRTVKKSTFTPLPQKKDSKMSYATQVSEALAAAGGRMSRDALSEALGFTGKKLENAMTRARMEGLAHRDGADVVSGPPPVKGNSAKKPSVKPAKTATPKKPRAKPTKRIAKPSILAKVESTKGVDVAGNPAAKARLLRFIPCGPGADDALSRMIADSTRAIITAERGAIIVVGDRVEQEITPAALAALAKATAEVRV